MTACAQPKDSMENGNKKASDPNNPTYSGLIVEKEFYKKNGEPAGFTELYFRASIQDYFIKFCESEVTRKDLEPYIDQAITVKAEVNEGNWDICPSDTQEQQSRIGYYMMIKSVL